MGCSESNAAPKNGSVWAELKQRLPLDKTPEQQKKRDILFSKFDEKKKNSLSLEECLVGCKKHLELDKLSKNLPEVNKRAYAAASGLRTRTDSTADVDPAEFRLYLQYLRDYFELNVMFDEVDTSDDRIVTLAEFKSALPRIEKWGLKISNPDEEFKKVDKNGKGVTFDAFADWAIRHNLDAEKDAAAGAIPQAAPAATAPATEAKKEEPKKEEAKKESAAPAVVAAAAPAAAGVAATGVAATEAKKEEPKKEEHKKEEAHVAAAAPAPAHEAKKEETAPAAASHPVEEKKEAAHTAAHVAPVAATATATAAHVAPAAATHEQKEEKKEDAAPVVAAASVPLHAPVAETKKEEAAPVAAAAAPTTASAAQKRKDLWPELKKRLPRKKTPEDNAARDSLFTQFDPNGNGYLSYAEIERGATQILKLDEFTDELHPILVRAYNAARNARKGAGANAETQDAYVERVEFRLLLVYIYDYFELWVAFDEIDAGDDKKVTLEEFKHALPKFQKWGVPINDVEAEFKSIDVSGNGSVTFAEFSEWAINKHLNADGEENQK